MHRSIIAAALITAGLGSLVITSPAITSPAVAQSAPGLTNSTFISSQKLQASRAEATNTAAMAERREQTIAAHKAQVRLLDAQARAAAIPTMRINTGGPSPVSVVMPTGPGLVPGGSSGDTNYHVNVQVGEGNQSAITKTSVSSEETISSSEGEE